MDNDVTAKTAKKGLSRLLFLCFDGSALIFWKIFCLFGMLIWLILRALSQFINGIWKALGEVEGVNGIWRPFNSFFRGLCALWRVIWWIPGFCLYAFINGMNQKPWVRITIFLLVLSIAGVWYWFYGPQPTWGKWYGYQNGVASHYGRGFYFRRTASGEWFLPGLWYSAAHKELPLGTTVLVVNQENGRKLALRINDRGPFIEGRIIDLSLAAAKWLGITNDGTSLVAIYTRKPFHKDVITEAGEDVADQPASVKSGDIPGEWKSHPVEQSAGKSDKVVANPVVIPLSQPQRENNVQKTKSRMILEDPVIIPDKKGN